jgi:hypothetical protein
MATQVEQWQVRTWSRNVTHLAQQTVNKLMGTTEEESAAPGIQIAFSRIGPMRGERGRPTRFRPTPEAASEETRRIALPNEWAFGKKVDQWDQLETFHELRSNYTRAAAADRNRFRDELIIGVDVDGTFANVLGGALGIGREDESLMTSVTLPAAQILGGAGVVINRAAASAIMAKFKEADYDPAMHGPITFVYDPRFIQTIHADPTMSSQDFVSARVLETGGSPEGFMGFSRWVWSNLLPKAGDLVRCVAYAQSGVGLGVWQNERSRFAERADLSFVGQLYMEQSLGAVRIDDKLVVALDVDTTAIPPL